MAVLRGAGCGLALDFTPAGAGCRTVDTGASLRQQYNLFVGEGFDGFAAERHGMVTAGGPVVEQVGVVLARRVAGLAGDVGHDGAVPIADVEDFAPRGAVGLAEIGAAGSIDGVAVAGAGHGTELPFLPAERVREGEGVELAPLPFRLVFAEAPFDLGLDLRPARARHRLPDFVDQGGARIGAQLAVPLVEIVLGGQLRGPFARGNRDHILLHALEIGDVELVLGMGQHFADAVDAVGNGPAVVAQRNRVARRQDVVVGGGDPVARRVEFGGQGVRGLEAAPFVTSFCAGHWEQTVPPVADRRQAADLPADVAGSIGINQILRGHAVARHGGAELRPILRAGKGNTGHIARGARLAPDPAQRVGEMPRGVFIDHRAVDRIPQGDVTAGFALHFEALGFRVEFPPRAAVAVLGGVRGVDGFDVQVLLIDAHDGEAPRDGLVVPERDAGQGGFARADRVPTGTDQVYRLAQRRELHGTVRVVGEERPAGRREAAVHHPVVAALLG